MQPEIPGPGMSLATKFLIGSMIFFVCAAGAAAYMFFGGGNIVSSNNIDLEVVMPSLVDGGKETQLQFIAQNRNRTPLQLVDLVIDYPDGTRDPQDQSKTLTHDRLSIGTIDSGAQVKKTTSAVFFGQEGTQQKVHVSLEYTIAGSNAVFVKEGEADFLLGSSPISLSVDAPKEAVAGEPFDITVTVQSNSQNPIEHVVVEGQYPFGFSFLSSSPKADVNGLLWRLGTLMPGDKKVIRLTGQVDASAGDERVVRFAVGSDPDETDTRIPVPFIIEPVTLSVEKPFIAGTLSVDGKTGSTVSVAAGKSVQGTITWQNNLQDPVSDLKLTLTFDGSPLDTTSITGQNGFYQSQTRSIVWTKDQDPTLAQVPPGQSGTYYFSFATLPPGSGGVLYTNPSVTLTLNVEGSRQGESGVPQSVTSAAQMQVTLGSNVSLEAKATASGGTIPPRAEQDTTYSVVWTVKNSSNAVANASVSTVLPPYVKFDGAMPGSSVSYDAASRTVRWELGDIAAGAGYSTAARTASFSVVLSASASQVGQTPALTGAALLIGQDRYAQIPVQASADAPTTGSTVGSK
jgi:hypothetical protein